MYVLWRRLASLRVQVSSLTTPLSLVYAYSGLNNPDFSFIFFFFTFVLPYSSMGLCDLFQD